MRRILVAASALLVAAGVSGALLLATAHTGASEVYALTRDLPAGAPVSADALRVERVDVGESARVMVGPSNRPVLDHALAAHDLRAGQLLERADLAAEAGSSPDRRYVLIAVRDAPPITAGDRLDLLMLTGAPDHLAITPFALGLEVHAVTPAGVVVVAPSRQAAALAYASIVARLVAVVADPGAPVGHETAVQGLDQAAEALRG